MMKKVVSTPSPGSAPSSHATPGRVVLVGTYKGDIPEDAERVIVRTADFATAPKVRKQLKAYLESSDRKGPDLAKRLPEIIVKLRPDQLRVCESTVQIELFSRDKLQPVHLPKQGEFTAVELFAGASGLSIGLERAGIHAVIANEIMPDFAATLAANHPDTDVVTEAIYFGGCMNTAKKRVVAVTNEVLLIDDDFIKSRIFTIRGAQVMLDRDLAVLYGVTTKRLNEQVKRNMARFPTSFRFLLSKEEMEELVANCDWLRSMKHSSVPMSANAIEQQGGMTVRDDFNRVEHVERVDGSVWQGK